MFRKILFMASFVHAAWTVSAQINIIPQPVSLKVPQTVGEFVVGQQTKIIAKDEGLQNSVHFLNDYLQEFYGFCKSVSYFSILLLFLQQAYVYLAE